MDWTNPVIHLDFAQIQYTTEVLLDRFLNDVAKKENVAPEESETRLIGVKLAQSIGIPEDAKTSVYNHSLLILGLNLKNFWLFLETGVIFSLFHLLF
jgi:hypothetical protein